jgi:transposase
LEKQITQCDQAITRLIAADAVLAHKAKRLNAIPGGGPVVAATVLAEMPELGQLTKQTAAVLAEVAPYNRDSGSQKGVRQHQWWSSPGALRPLPGHFAWP